jgi:hypothetical protein
VIRRHVLAALAQGVEAGDDGAAREALASTEWVLRGTARRRLERALIDAAYLTGEGFSVVDTETMRHLQRVAALDVAGKNDVDVTDRAAVARTYYELETQAVPRVPLAAILLGSGLLVAMILFVLLAITVRTPGHRGHRAIPAVSGAYLVGGVPAQDPAIAAFLEKELTQLVIETDADRRGSRDGAPRAKRVAELRDAAVIRAQGPGLAHAWRALIDSLDRWSEISIHAARFHDAIRDLGGRAQDVSEQFAALGLGYYISADVLIREGNARAVIFSYRVEDVAFVRAGGDARRVLSLRRLDRLNLDLALLGRQGDELGDPVVLLDQVDDLVTDRVMPVLDGETYRLGDPGWRRGSQSGRLLAAYAAAGIERELRAVFGTAAQDRDARTTIARRLVAATVRRHEARHAIDYDRERPLRYPKALLAMLGARDGSTLRTELELAAYVSQIANDPATPQFSLWNVAGHAFNQRWGSSESYVAVVILEGLARQLGSVPQNPVVRAGHLDREALANLARPLAEQSSENLRAAARMLWTELYGEPLLPIVDVRAGS